MKRFIARTTRGGMTESEHDGIVAVVSSTGELLAHHGDTSRVTFARSACKPFQALPLVESGAFDAFGFEEADLTMCCASHSSELIHTDRVAAMLKRIGLDESYLQCGPHLPHSMPTYDQLILAGTRPSPLYSNCSGKHTGMLAYCVHTGTDPHTYHHLNHPLQQEILRVLADTAQIPATDIVVGVDGCGVPVHAMPLERWAFAFAQFANPDQATHGGAMRRVSAAMRHFPELVGGTVDRFDTDLMVATGGRIQAKGGAEGFMMIVVTDHKFALTIKILDGNERAIPPVVVELLTRLGALSASERDGLAKYQRPTLFNTRGEAVGEIIPDL